MSCATVAPDPANAPLASVLILAEGVAVWAAATSKAPMTVTVALFARLAASTMPARTSELMSVVALAAAPLARPKAPALTVTSEVSSPTDQIASDPAVMSAFSPIVALVLLVTSPVAVAAPTPINPPAEASELTCWRLAVLAERMAAPVITSLPEVSIPASTFASLCAAAKVDCTPRRIPPPEARAVTSSLERPVSAPASARTERLPSLKSLPAPPTLALASRLVRATAVLAPTPAVLATVMPATSAVCPTSDKAEAVRPPAVIRTAEAVAVTLPFVVTSAVPPPAAKARSPAAIEVTSTAATRSDCAFASTNACPAKVVSAGSTAKRVISVAAPSIRASVTLPLVIVAFAPPPDSATPPYEADVADAEEVTRTSAKSLARTVSAAATTSLSRRLAVMLFESVAVASDTEIAIAPPSPTEPEIDDDRTVALMLDESMASAVTRPRVAVKLELVAVVDTA